MTKAVNTFTAQIPARKAELAVPGKLDIGGATLQVGAEAETHTVFLGREAKRFPLRWTKKAAAGEGFVEIRPTSKLTSEIVVALEAPRGIVWRLLGTGQGLRSLAELFARALRYEIETRGADDADGFDLRRTTVGLVKARTA